MWTSTKTVSRDLSMPDDAPCDVSVWLGPEAVNEYTDVYRVEDVGQYLLIVFDRDGAAARDLIPHRLVTEVEIRTPVEDDG